MKLCCTKPILFLYVFLIGFSPKIFAQELSDPWVEYYSTKMNVDKHKVEKKDQIPLAVMQSDDESTLCDRPILLFLGGFLPSVGKSGYKNLIEKLAKRNISVIYPIYLSTSLSDQMDNAKEYDSGKFADDIKTSVQSYVKDTYSSCKKVPAMTLYGHSMGARVAISLSKRMPESIASMILDSVLPGEGLKGGIIDKEFLRTNGNLQPLEVNFPVTVIHYEGDKILKSGTDRAYGQIKSKYKQYFEIKSYVVKDPRNPNKIIRTVSADHFTPFSGVNEKKEMTKLFRDNVLSSGEEIHGYKIDLSWNEVDEYSTYPLLTAITWSAVPTDEMCKGAESMWIAGFENTEHIEYCEYAQKIHQWATLESYGKNREMIYGGMKVREVKSQGDYFKLIGSQYQ